MCVGQKRVLWGHIDLRTPKSNEFKPVDNDVKALPVHHQNETSDLDLFPSEIYCGVQVNLCVCFLRNARALKKMGQMWRPISLWPPKSDQFLLEYRRKKTPPTTAGCWTMSCFPICSVVWYSLRVLSRGRTSFTLPFFFPSTSRKCWLVRP